MRLAAVVTFLSGLYFVLYFLLPESVLSSWGVMALHPAITQGYIVVGVMAFGVGIINLSAVHLRQIFLGKKDALFSFVLITSLLSTIIFGLLDWHRELVLARFFQKAKAYQTFFEAHPDAMSDRETASVHALATEGTQLRVQAFDPSVITQLTQVTQGREVALHLAALVAVKEDAEKESLQTSIAAAVSSFLHEGIFVPLGSSMFALLSFYIASAAFRAFRLRSFEAALLMVTAVLVVFGQVSFIASHWDGFALIRNWLLTVPNTAAFRGISLGASVASIVLAIRVWLSMDNNQAGS